MRVQLRFGEDFNSLLKRFKQKIAKDDLLSVLAIVKSLRNPPKGGGIKGTRPWPAFINVSESESLLEDERRQ